MKKNVLSFPPSREHTLDSRLRFAIANKRLIRFTYESAVRVAEPHDYGVRDGAPKLLAFQRQKGGRKRPTGARLEMARHLKNSGLHRPRGLVRRDT